MNSRATDKLSGVPAGSLLRVACSFVGIRGFLGAEGNNWGAIMAASSLTCLPIFLIYIFLQGYVVDAFVRSGLK